ncbi:MAG: DbpA RNA binding domain-containing protein [Gemmatimonas sp.]
MGDEERDTPGVTRVQHVVLHGPADGRTMAAALRPAIERSRDAKGIAAPACLVITPTVEQALAVADAARTLLDDDTHRVVPVTAVIRARRVLQAGPVAVVAGAPHDLLALRKDASLDLQSLRSVVLVGLDELLADGADETLQSLLADAPADAMRIATLDSETEATDAFIEAQMRRARRVNPVVQGDGNFVITPRYAVSTPAARAELLRAVLDEIDPPSLVVIATSEAGETDARRALARLGIAINSETVNVTRHAPNTPASLVVLWESPAGVEAITEALAGHPANAVAFLLPDEVPSFHRLTGGAAQPWTPTVRKDSIESRTRTLRTALRSTLANGGASASELALLAPLLDSHDAIEIAAAALRLYEGAKRESASTRAKAPIAGAPMRSDANRGAPAARGSAPLELMGDGQKQRVFLAVGRRDDVQVGDIVGAIANEAGIDGGRIGSIALFESHATVELDAADAARVVELMGNVELRGRKLGARIDERSGPGGAYGGESRGRSSGGDRAGGERSSRSGGFGKERDRGDRPPRGGDRDRGGERSPRSARTFGPPRDRSERSESGERPARPSFGDREARGERPARSFGDRPERGDRPSRFGGERSERPSFGDRGDRPARPSFGDRSERPARPTFGDRSERPARSSFGSDRGERGARPERSGPPRGDGPRGGGGRSSFSRGEPRASDERRSFGDRPISERTEAKKEWSSRGDSMKNAKRAPRKSPGTFDEI